MKQLLLNGHLTLKKENPDGKSGFHFLEVQLVNHIVIATALVSKTIVAILSVPHAIGTHSKNAHVPEEGLPNLIDICYNLK